MSGEDMYVMKISLSLSLSLSADPHGEAVFQAAGGDAVHCLGGGGERGGDGGGGGGEVWHHLTGRAEAASDEHTTDETSTNPVQ